MANAYFTVVTNAGTQKMLEAVNENKKVNIIEFGVGDGAGKYYIPTADMTALKNEVWRGTTNACYVSEQSDHVMIVESLIPEEIGGFTIREMGLFDDTGTLIAICNSPDTKKAKLSEGVVQELSLSIEIALTNTDSVEMKIDPSVVMATKKDLQILKDDIEKKLEDAGKESQSIADFTIQSREMISRLQEDMKKMEARLSLMELMYATEIKKNPFSVTFGNLDGLVVEGIWNAPQKRVDF